MEFTYEGIVRWGFGFFNPNHAAAFFCAILPFAMLFAFSRGFAQKIFGICLSVAILAAVALTYSRAGILVASLEIFAMALWGKRRNAAVFAAIFLLFIAVIFATSAASRIAYDTAMSNRLLIWRAGLALFAQNPLGVGFGNSGEIVSAFVLPSDISCRTLVNSHLTLICEFGVFFGIVWFSAIFYAISNGIAYAKTSKLKFATLVSFCGLLLSASFSSVFDFDVLFNPTKFEYLSKLNLVCEWVTFVVFVCIFLNLIFGKFWNRAFMLSLLCASILLIFCMIFTTPKSVFKVRKLSDEIFIETSSVPSSLVLFDDNYNLKSAVAFLKKHNMCEGILISQNSWQNMDKIPDTPTQTLILFGNCVDFIDKCNARKIIIEPPTYFRDNTKNISKIYIPKWDSSYDKMRRIFPEEKIVNF